MSNIQLFGSYTSPYVRHCRIALNQADTAYEFIETDHATSDKTSPTKRVPYLHDGDIQLHDSSAILQHIRLKQGQPFLPTVAETDKFALANTVLDTTINLFLLELSGITDAGNSFLQRQHARIDTGLLALNDITPAAIDLAEMDDANWRAACLLDWGLYRERLHIDNAPNLRSFLDTVNTWDLFKETAPNITK